MRCLFVADLHYSLPQFDWLLQAAPRYDVVALAGDALDLGSDVDYRAQTLVVRKYLQRLAGVTQLIVSSGNHDLDSLGTSGEKVPRWIEDVRPHNVACDGESLVLGDTLFTICPWWDGPVAREALVAQLAADAKRRQGLRWVWVHHAPAKDSPTSWSGSRTMGDADLVQWIGEHGPDLVVGGHIHQSPFVKGGSWADRLGETWVFNVGHQFGAPPAHIVVETDVNEALWMSQLGVQTVRLDAPLERRVWPDGTLPDWFLKPSRDRDPTPDGSPGPAGG